MDGYAGQVPPGHYYSPIPSLADIQKRRAEIFSKHTDLKGIDLNTREQVELLTAFARLKEDVPFYAETRRIRFNIDNGAFSYDDAPVLHYMLRHLKPERVIEIGSGHSSACMLDTSELYFSRKIKFTFIDIDCFHLRSNLREGDAATLTMIEQPVQAVDMAVFRELQPGDLLFIDSSHVVKTGSDLTTILFEILPALPPGVCVHFHDIRYPFEYHEGAVMAGIFWNEAYFLRAFLQYNDSFKITFWLNYLVNASMPEINERLRLLPLDAWARRFNHGVMDFSGAGGSIYLTKIK